MMIQVKIAFVFVTLASLFVIESSQFEMRYQVCTAEEMRQYMADFCMRMSARDTSSLLSVNPFGSIGNVDSESEQTEGADSRLIHVLRASTPITKYRRLLAETRTLRLHKRSLDEPKGDLLQFLGRCCSETCLINAEQLLASCSV